MRQPIARFINLSRGLKAERVRQRLDDAGKKN